MKERSTARTMGIGRRRWLAGVALSLALGPASLAHAAAGAPRPPLKPPAAPAAMPAFVLPTTAGAQLDSKSLQGQVLVIRFWASW